MDLFTPWFDKILPLDKLKEQCPFVDEFKVEYVKCFHNVYKVPEFDWKRYLNDHPDVKKKGAKDELTTYHMWIQRGRKNALVIGADKVYKGFPWNDYLKRNPDLGKHNIRSEMEAYQHWINHGRKEKRVVKFEMDLISEKVRDAFINKLMYACVTETVHVKEFDWKRYLDKYPDLVKAGYRDEKRAYEHWALFGRNEGRTAFCIKNKTLVLDIHYTRFPWINYVAKNPILSHLKNELQSYNHWVDHGRKQNLRVWDATYVMKPEGMQKIFKLEKQNNNFYRIVEKYCANVFNADILLSNYLDRYDKNKTTIEVMSNNTCYKLFEKYYNVIQYTHKDSKNLVVLWNIDYSINREIFDYRKKHRLPVFCIERGCLPNTIYIDDNESIYKTDKFHYEMWNKPLYNTEQDLITGYIKNIRDNKYTLETQNSRNIDTINTTGFSQVIFCPLQRRDDTSVTYYGGWVKSVDNFYSIVKNLSNKYKDVLFLIKNHPTDMLSARYKDNSTNFKFVDDYHVYDILELCDKVILINSGVGVFSMIYNKPCGILGKSFYHIPEVNTKINNEQDITTFIEDKSIAVNEEIALRYLYYLKFHYLYDANQKKDKSTNMKTVFNSNDILIRLNNLPKLNINNVMQGSIVWTFRNILTLFTHNRCKNSIGIDCKDEYDLYIKWRNHLFSNYHYTNGTNNKDTIDNSNSSPVDKSISFIHDDLEYNKNIPRTERTCLESRSIFHKYTQGLLITSILQMKTIIMNNNYSTKSIIFSQLDGFNIVERKYATDNKIRISYPFRFYGDNVKNIDLLMKVLSKLDNNFIINIYSTNVELFKPLLPKNIQCKINLFSDIDKKMFEYDDIILITSLSEGSPLPLYEGIGSHKYIVSTNCGNVSHIIPSYHLLNVQSGEDEVIKALNLIRNRQYYDIDSVYSNYRCLNTNIDIIISRYYLYNKSRCRFALLCPEHRKSRDFYNYIITKYTGSIISNAISSDLNKLTTFVKVFQPYYFIIWNGEFDEQREIISNLHKIYKNELFSRLIVIENGLFQQRDTVRLKRVTNINFDQIDFQLSVINSLNTINPSTIINIQENSYYCEKNQPITLHNYTLVLMQLDKDTTIQYHSRFNSNNEFIEFILSLQIEGTIVFKLHPLDKTDYSKYKNSNIIFITVHTNLKTLISNSIRCITVNSSTHCDVLWYNKPLFTCGIGIFTKKNVSYALNTHSTYADIIQYTPNKSAISYYLQNIVNLTYDLRYMETYENNIRYNICLYWNII